MEPLIYYPDLQENNGFDFIRYKETMQPLITIASNNGFSFMKDL